MTNPRIAYREADVRGATAVRLVVLLYEQTGSGPDPGGAGD